MSKRSDIVDAVVTALQGIKQASSYGTDAGDRVYINREFELSPPEKPAMVLTAKDVTDTLGGDVPPSQGEENHNLSIEVEGYIITDERGTEAEQLRDDILKALFGGLTEGYSGNISSSVDVEDAGDEGFLGTVQVNAAIFYVTAYGSAD